MFPVGPIVGGSSDTEEWIELESGWFGSKTSGGDFLRLGVSLNGVWGMKIKDEERVEERARGFSRPHLLPHLDLIG